MSRLCIEITALSDDTGALEDILVGAESYIREPSLSPIRLDVNGGHGYLTLGRTYRLTDGQVHALLALLEAHTHG